MGLCYLLDVDNTIVPSGSDELFPGVVEKVNTIISEGNEVWLFTCRPENTEWICALKSQGLRFRGIIHKPFSQQGYIIIDDKLVEGRQKL
jgi:predicted HAD superfamily phosphohydrolase YqeG